MTRPAAVLAADGDDNMTEIGFAEVGKQATLGNGTEAKARAVAHHIAWLLPCLLLWGWFFTSRFPGLTLSEAMDTAQLGRQVSEGRGFTTEFLRPLSLARVPSVSPHPDLYNAPLYPVVLAIAFNVARPDDGVVSFISVAFGFLTVLMTYGVALRLFGKKAAWLAAVLLAFHLGFLRTGVSGLGVTFLAFLVTLLFYLLLRHRDTPGWSLLCGATAALIYLADYAYLALALPALGMLVSGRRANRLRHAVLFAAGFTIVALPWLARNWVVAQHPFFGLRSYSIASYTSYYPRANIYQYTDPGFGSPLGFVTSQLRQVIRKVLVNVGSLYGSLPVTCGLGLLPLLGVALFLDLGAKGGNRAKWGFFSALILVSLVLAVAQPRMEMLVAFLGVGAAIGAGALTRALEHRRFGSRAQAAAIAAVLVVAVVPLVIASVIPSDLPTPNRQNLEYIGRLLRAEAVVMADQPWAVAWYADRAAIWLPHAPIPRPEAETELSLAVAADPTRSPSYRKLEGVGVKPDAIFLSGRLPQYQPGHVDQWRLLHDVLKQQLAALQRGQASGEPWTPPGWELAASLPGDEFLLVRSGAIGGGEDYGGGEAKAPTG